MQRVSVCNDDPTDWTDPSIIICATKDPDPVVRSRSGVRYIDQSRSDLTSLLVDWNLQDFAKDSLLVRVHSPGL